MASFDRLEAPRAGTRLERHGVKPGDRVRIGSVDSTGRLTPYEIGVLGGTFDPPHLGHLRLAEVAREHLRLDVVVFVPAGNPYRKAAQKGTPAHLRVRLLRAALEGMAWAEVSTVEVDTPGPSYSDETLALLAAARPGIDTGRWFIAAPTCSRISRTGMTRAGSSSSPAWRSRLAPRGDVRPRRRCTPFRASRGASTGCRSRR
ncbi:MAG: nicotinate-nicotinamide nucleotide adenylyltransferase [Dehalococcoidia bacterium]